MTKMSWSAWRPSRDIAFHWNELAAGALWLLLRFTVQQLRNPFGKSFLQPFWSNGSWDRFTWTCNAIWNFEGHVRYVSILIPLYLDIWIFLYFIFDIFYFVCIFYIFYEILRNTSERCQFCHFYSWIFGYFYILYFIFYILYSIFYILSFVCCLLSFIFDIFFFFLYHFTFHLLYLPWNLEGHVRYVLILILLYLDVSYFIFWYEIWRDMSDMC
jgi:hypothetical protein